ncbi:putative rhamnogalacturonase [Paramyrothecium foliicola]|nr:putative rhamnogalacturonase [Paramyrothecium foliicola]
MVAFLTRAAVLLLGSVAPAAVHAAFGFTTSGNNYVVDAGSSNSLVFTVNRANCDITSIKYRGVELQTTEGKGTHVGSGLGAAASATKIGDVVKITCETTGITQYIIAKAGDSTIYLGTHITQPYGPGELRYLARLRSSVLPFEHPFGSASTTSSSTSTVEGSDVFVVNGETRSKFYSSQRFIDDKVHCVYGESTPEPIRACMVIPQYESSSGGPFFRDINSNVAAPTSHLYFYMNSGHVRTEDWRMGFHGPYYIQFSRTGTPSANADLSWYNNLGLKGYVPDSERGRVSGTVSGVDPKYQRVVHWYNAAAQYWAYANSAGAFTSPAMKPGTYTMVLYQTEFKVATSSVTVSKGSTTTKNIASSQAARNTIWRIGDVDGQPAGFRNFDKILRMHPSDKRMSSWGPLTYTVGSSTTNDFAMALFKDVNNPQTIRFDLTSVPSGTVTLRIATTLSFGGGRPAASVNGWNGPTPAAPTKIDSRGVTRGAYRGYGEVYDVTIPAGTLKTGTNTITINVVSGSGDTGFLSANVVSWTYTKLIVRHPC